LFEWGTNKGGLLANVFSIYVKICLDPVSEINARLKRKDCNFDTHMHGHRVSNFYE
jgi:hypothetical protein